MAFPSAGILDDFNRADQSPAVGWADSIDGGAYGNVKVLSNVLATITTDAYSYWNTSYAANQEHYVTVPTLPGTAFSMYSRLNPIATSGVDGYELEVVVTGLKAKRVDNNGPTQLGATIVLTFSAGDSAGIELIGDQFTTYYKSGAGAWASQGARTDATYIQAGYLGHYLWDTTPRLDNFGGGAIVVAGGRPKKSRRSVARSRSAHAGSFN